MPADERVEESASELGVRRVSSFEDQIVDELLGDDLDWIRLVRTYPRVSLLLAGVGGFLLGRSRGPMIVAALSAFAAGKIDKSLSQLLGEDPR